MINVEQLTKRYNGAAVADHVSFTARPGRVTGFLGPNGAGKSTVLRMICGLTRPTAGSSTVLGCPSQPWPILAAGSECSLTPPASTPGGQDAKPSR